VEAALVLPVLLLLLVGLIDFGRAYYLSIEVQSAAEAGALYGAQNATDTAGIQAAAQADAADVPGGIPLPTVVTGCMCSNATQKSVGCATAPTNCSNNSILVNYVTVNTSYTYSILFRLPGIPSSLVLKGSATMRM
jgi:Flp pilus assembly protein TadG